MTVITAMCTQFYACPLCAHPSFNTLDSLRNGLVSVATRPLTCPVCNDTVLGIDKLTIHLFGHTIEQKNNNTNNENKTLVMPVWSALCETSKCEENNQQIIKINVFNKNNSVDKLNNSVPILNEQQILHVETPSNDNAPIQGPFITAVPVIFNEIPKNLASETNNQYLSIWKDNIALPGKDNSKNKSPEQHINDNNDKDIPQISHPTPELISPENTIATHQQMNLHIPRLAEGEDQVVEKKSKIQGSKELVKPNEISEEQVERCDICGFILPNKDLLVFHKQLAHLISARDVDRRPEDLLKNYPCHLCSKVFKMRGSLMIHMRVAHTGSSGINEIFN
uniref:C2H2-type domain-containing protein n=1 Tax=Bracon brevicornis TaxID=1563983 RepID=A0A6V7ISS9_9HYME